MQDALEFKVNGWRSPAEQHSMPSAGVFVVAVVLCTIASAIFATSLPLQVSIATVFLFAGPHNLAELRYFLMRLPVRFGKSRNFFLTAFTGLGFLTITYVSLPLIYRSVPLSDEAWLTVIASWNTLLLVWLGLLVWLRGKQKTRTNWSWAVPLVLGLCAFNWFQPDFFSLTLVYIHPLIALWFLDRHLKRNRPTWLRPYRRCLLMLPLILGLMIWQLSSTSALAEDNGLFWRITQHSGAQLLPNVSSHLLVSVHLFLEMLHYGVWLLALPLLGRLAIGPAKRPNPGVRIWDLKSVPLVRHPRGFPKAIAVALGVGVVLVLMLWVGFSVDYATTRDIYFTFAIAHVMAEAPFLLKMIQTCGWPQLPPPVPTMSPSELWRFLPIGYLLTIAIETPILCLGLSSRHSLLRRLLAGVWLTACTYPIVTLVLPLLFVNSSRRMFLLVAEVFAPVAECALFWSAFGTKDELGRKGMWRDFLVIAIANLASFGVGEILNAWEWFGLV